MSRTNFASGTVVLVHAAWADASSWSKVIVGLQQQGVRVVSVQIPLTSLKDDVASVRRTLRRLDGPVVLAGHSYGGAVITAAGRGQPDVKALVYIAAMAPDAGETVGQLLHRVAPHASAPQLVPDQEGLLWMSPQGFADAVAHQSSAEEKALMAATQKPIAMACLVEPMTQPAWKETRSWFLLAEKDRMIAPHTQRFMAERMGARILALDVDHTPLTSAPERVVEVIAAAIDAA